MYLDLLKTNIHENYNLGYEKVFESVKAWLQSRGFREDDFSDPVFIDKHKLDIIEQSGTQYGPGERITIPDSEYRKLLDAEAVLVALENAGVDNWDGYAYAMRDV